MYARQKWKRTYIVIRNSEDRHFIERLWASFLKLIVELHLCKLLLQQYNSCMSMLQCIMMSVYSPNSVLSPPTVSYHPYEQVLTFRAVIRRHRG